MSYAAAEVAMQPPPPLHLLGSFWIVGVYLKLLLPGQHKKHVKKRALDSRTVLWKYWQCWELKWKQSERPLTTMLYYQNASTHLCSLWHPKSEAEEWSAHPCAWLSFLTTSLPFQLLVQGICLLHLSSQVTCSQNTAHLMSTSWLQNLLCVWVAPIWFIIVALISDHSCTSTELDLLSLLL